MTVFVLQLLLLAVSSFAKPLPSNEAQTLNSEYEVDAYSNLIIRRSEVVVDAAKSFASQAAVPAAKPQYDSRRPNQPQPQPQVVQQPPRNANQQQQRPQQQQQQQAAQTVTITVVQTVEKSVFLTPLGCARTQVTISPSQASPQQPQFQPQPQPQPRPQPGPGLVQASPTWGINPPGAPPLESAAAPGGIVAGIGSLLGTLASGWRSGPASRTTMAGGQQVAQTPQAAPQAAPQAPTVVAGAAAKPGYTPPSLPGSGYWGDRR